MPRQAKNLQHALHMLEHGRKLNWMLTFGRSSYEHTGARLAGEALGAAYAYFLDRKEEK